MNIIVDYEYDNIVANKITLRQAIATANSSSENVNITFAQNMTFIYISTPIVITKSTGSLVIDGLVSGLRLLVHSYVPVQPLILKSFVHLVLLYRLVTFI